MHCSQVLNAQYQGSCSFGDCGKCAIDKKNSLHALAKYCKKTEIVQHRSAAEQTSCPSVFIAMVI